MRYAATDSRLSQSPSAIDWLYRYEPVLDFMFEVGCYDVLDFGSGNVGLGSVFAGSYYGIDIIPIHPAVPNLIPIEDIHPFDLTQQFDLVCAMDVLEHIPVQERTQFWQTLKRISRKWIILSYPTSTTGRLFDVETLSFFSRGTQSIPPWLLEHLAQEHPDPNQVSAAIQSLNLKILRRINHTNRLWHYLGCIGVAVEGPWKIKILNDIHIMSEALSHVEELATYREVLILEV